jgi:hypothetical protein
MDLGSPRGGGVKLSARQPVYDEEEEDQYEDGDRPIRPKQTTDYNDRDPEIEPMGTSSSLLRVPHSSARESGELIAIFPCGSTPSRWCAESWRAANPRRAKRIGQVSFLPSFLSHSALGTALTRVASQLSWESIEHAVCSAKCGLCVKQPF